MISFKKPLYLGRSLKLKKLRTMRRISRGKLCRNVYLITDPANSENLFDIIEAKLLLIPYYKEKDVTVYAMAGSRKEARELLLKLVEEKYADS